MLKNEATNKRVFVVLVIVVTAFILIAMVIWVFNKRIDQIESQRQDASSAQSAK